MVLQHFLQLAHYHRKLLLAIMLATGGIAWLLSLVLLFASPMYSGITRVMMLPDQAELEFTRGWVAESQFSALQVMPQTHMEYLLSQPVLERTIDKIFEAFAGQQASQPSFFKRLFTAAKAAFWRTYNTLNYGYHVPLTPRQEAYADLLEGTEIEMVEASYILEIEVTLKDPIAAKVAANSLAQAYQEHVAQQSQDHAEKLQQYLNSQLAEKEAQIKTLEARAHEHRAQLGISSLTDQQALNSALLEDERKKLADDRIEIEELRIRLDVLSGTKRKAQSPDTVAKVEEEITLGEARLKALGKTIPAREAQIAKLMAGITDLSAGQPELEQILKSIEHTETNIVELKKRIGMLDLAKSNTLDQLQIIEEAAEPLYPSFPKVFLNTVIGLIAGALAALFVLVVIDTSSARIKTTADLRRLVSERCIGWVSKYILRKDVDVHNFSVRRLGENIERQLTLFNGFNASRIIYVMGFGNDEFVDESADAVQRALSSRGLTVDVVPAGTEAAREVTQGANQYLMLNAGTVSSKLDLKALAEKSAALVCVLRAGEVFEETLLAFNNNALESGFDALTFVLVSE